MAYNPRPRQQAPPHWGYENPLATSNGHYANEYRPHDITYEGERSRAAQQRQPKYEVGYSPQEDYNGYSQNPWSNDADLYGGNQDDYMNHDDNKYYTRGAASGKQHPAESRSRPYEQNLGAYQDSKASGGLCPHRPLPARNPYSQESNDDQLESFDRQLPQKSYRPAYGYEDAPNHVLHGDYVLKEAQDGMHSARNVNSRDQVQNKGGNSDDQLPRYMNGHAHRFSNDESQPRPIPERCNGVAGLGTIERYGASQSRSGAGQDEFAADGSWNTSNPNPSRTLQHGAHGGSTSSYLSKGKTSLDTCAPSHGTHAAMPQTAGDFRRDSASPPGDKGHFDRSGGSIGNHDPMPEPASAPPVGMNGRIGKPSGFPGPSNYERSRTMPTVASEYIADAGLIPVDNLVFQEPAAVSGYYGPGEASHGAGRPRAPSRSQSDNTRWANKGVARPIHTQDGRQQPFHQESRGEIVNTFEGERTNHYASNEERRFANQRSPPAEDEMPTFDALQSNGHHGQGMTIDDHLQNQEKHMGQPSHQARKDRFQGYPDDVPRSRSQPDFSGPPRPSGRQGPGFAPSGSRPAPYDRPATSASSRGYGHLPVPSPHGYTSRSRGPGGSSRGRIGTNGPMLPGDWGPRKGYGGPNGPETAPHQDRYRSPPGLHGKPPRDPRQPHGPWGPPPPIGDGLSDDQIQRPDRLRSPPAQYGRSALDQMQQRNLHRSPPVDNNRGASDRTPQPDSKAPGAKHKGQNLSLDKPLPNPDALPHHPAPARPGHNAGQISSPSSRPAPVRQYNSPPSDPVQQSTSQSASGRRGSNQVTHQELEQLRQKTLRNPNDSAAQYLLAQKLVEAADMLVDDRADPGMKKRNRERFQSDALKIIKKLSALSYPEADFYYADCYSRGALGLQPDIKEAFFLYQKAAKANNAQAAYRVAVCCELGQEDGGGTKRDAVKAMQWYRRAAMLGDVAAKYKMGVILLKGLLGQPRNPQEGITWLKQAADQADKENPHALHELALLHEKPMGMDGIRQDEAYSRQLFTRSANLGYKFSQFRLGCAYEYGLLGCPVDPRQSIAWYSKAAVQEEHQSELALSGWYLTGADSILQQSDTEAYLWARKAAQAGLAKAEYAMGYFTEVGIGAPANLEDAKRWYWKSASQNFPKARDRLEDLRRGGGPKQKTRVSRTNMRKQSDGECTVM